MDSHNPLTALRNHLYDLRMERYEEFKKELAGPNYLRGSESRNTLYMRAQEDWDKLTHVFNQFVNERINKRAVIDWLNYYDTPPLLKAELLSKLDDLRQAVLEGKFYLENEVRVTLYDR